jgi:hypothetical protein
MLVAHTARRRAVDPPEVVVSDTDARPHPPAPDRSASTPPPADGAPELWCPFSVRIDGVARFLNAELVDDPVHTGLELQWFDDERGRGMLAFLERRDDRLVDYHVAPGLALDRSTYHLAAGTGAWIETRFDADRLEVTEDGVVAEVRFRDRDGREVEVRVDDRAAGRRRSGLLLAPVGAAVDRPTSLLLVLLHGFDLVRRTARPPRVRIDGRDVATGRLPAAPLHRRHLIKAAAPLVIASVCPQADGPIRAVDRAAPGDVVLTADGDAVAGVVATDGDHRAELRLDPALPPLARIDEAGAVSGSWRIVVDGRRITGGRWTATRDGDHVAVELEVTDRWRPARGMPPLLAVVTRLVSTFRTWPTTYRWRADLELGADPRLRSRWERTGTDRGGSYRRATAPGRSRVRRRR